MELSSPLHPSDFVQGITAHWLGVQGDDIHFPIGIVYSLPGNMAEKQHACQELFSRRNTGKECAKDKKMHFCSIWEALVQKDKDKERESSLFVTNFPGWAAKQDILLQFSFLSLISIVFRTPPLLLAQHFHYEVLFSREFRNWALENFLST